MTILSSTFRTDWLAADGVNKDWSYDFSLKEDAVVVEVRDEDGVITTFTSGFEHFPTDETEGFVRYPSVGDALAVGNDVRISRSVPYTQPTAIGQQGRFHPEIHETALDRATIQIQQLKDFADRAPKVPAGDVAGIWDVGAEDELVAFGVDGGGKPAGHSITDLEAIETAAATSATEAAAAAASAAASAVAVSAANAKLVESRAAAIALNVPPTVTFIKTAGYANPGDGGGALYVEGEASSPGGFTSADGTEWELAGPFPAHRLMFGGTTAAENTAALLLAIAGFDEVVVNAGTYDPIDITASNKTLHMLEGVIFKVPDGEITAVDTDGPPAFKVTGSNVTIFGDFTCDGNYSNQTMTAFLDANHTGTAQISGDNFRHKGGTITIQNAFHRGLTVDGGDDSGDEVLGFRADTVRIVNPRSYATLLWSLDDWEIRTIEIDAGADSIDARVRTGTETSATALCKNGKIGSILSDEGVVLEARTEILQIDSIRARSFKTEDNWNIEIGQLIVDGSSLTGLNITAFGVIDCSQVSIRSVVVQDYAGTGNPVSLTGISNSNIGSVLVDGTTANVTDMLVRSAENVDIGSVTLVNPTGTGTGFHWDYDAAFAPQENVRIGSLISAGHAAIDILTENGGGLDIGYVNADALVSGNLATRIKGKTPLTAAYTEYATNASNADFTLTPGSSAQYIRQTANLTNHRTVTLSTTGAAAGVTRFTISRTGTGVGRLDVGSGPLASLMPGEWCEVVYDGAAYYLAARGYISGEGYQTVSTDAAFSLFPGAAPRYTIHNGTLTADRTVTLSTTNAYTGQIFKITRTGLGAFKLNIGAGTALAALAPGEWAEVVYNGSTWVLAARGRLGRNTTLTPDMFNAVGDGTADDAAAIRATYAAAIALGLKWQLGPLHRVDSTVTISSGGLQGAPGGTLINTSINDGTAVFKFAVGLGNFKVADVKVMGTGLDFEDWLAGTDTPTNAIGFKFGETAVGYTSRLQLENVHADGLAVGYDMRGFIISTNNVWATSCTLGLRGDTINSADLNLHIENCVKSFEITGSDGIVFRQLLDEGGHTAAIASTLDDCSGVEFQAVYYEAGPTAPRLEAFLKIGHTTKCYGVEINAAAITTAGAVGIPPIDIDECDGLLLRGRVNGGQYYDLIKTSLSTTNVRYEMVAPSSPFHQDDSKQIDIAENYFPNPNFDLWFRGWKSVVPTRCTISQETTLVRKGRNALKITAAAGQANNYCQFLLNSEEVVYLRGKTVRLGMWVYTPVHANIANGAGRTIFPAPVMQSYNGSATVSSTTVNTFATAGHWAFWITEVTVQSDATHIFVNAYVNQSANNADGTEYIVVNSITLCENTVPLYRHMMGDLRDSAMIYSTGVGGRMVAYDTAAPTDADQIYAIGDTVWKSNVAASGSMGWQATAAGAGAAAAFKTMPNLGA